MDHLTFLIWSSLDAITFPQLPLFTRSLSLDREGIWAESALSHRLVVRFFFPAWEVMPYGILMPCLVSTVSRTAVSD